MEFALSPRWRRLGWCVIAMGWAFVAASLISYNPADAPGHAASPANIPVANWCGPVGATIASEMVLVLGSGSWLLLLSIAGAIGLAIAKKPVDQPALRTVGAVLFALAFSGFHALFRPGASSAPEGAGGLIAIVGVAELTSRFSVFGTALALSLLAAVGAIVAYDRWLIAAPGVVRRLATPVMIATWAKLRVLYTSRAEARAARRIRLNDVDDDDRPAASLATSKRSASIKRKIAEPDADETPEPTPALDPEQLRKKLAKLPVRFAATGRKVATEEDLRGLQSDAKLEGYTFPGVDLLLDPEDNYSQKMDSFVRSQARALEEALRVYKIQGEVVGIDSGPVITLYEVKLAPGAKVAQLSAVSSDLARTLKAINIRIVPNMQGRDTVGVEVPNAIKERVRLKELMCHTRSQGASKMSLPMFLGKDAHGDPLIQDLAAMPHLLIAGATGAGKSVCINTIIMSFLYTKKPNDLKLVLIDPKMVELGQFRDIPHLMCPVVTEMGKACAILEWAAAKMDERYELLSEAGVRDIAAYNALDWEELRERIAPGTESEEARIPRKLPFIVFVIDELADLIITQKEVEGSIVRIAQKARAVGIHLVVATQRPQANVVTGLIKSNMPGRISFKVASGMDSRIVLDQKGGELLLGQGDMLFLSPRSHKLIRAQGTLVEDLETRRVVRFMRDVSAPSFERQLIQIGAGDAGDDAVQKSLDSAQEDPLFDKAVEIVLETKRGSVSLLQRRLSIGYTRSARLIDLMGMAGIIGDYKGTVAREVLITPEVWEAMKSQAESDADQLAPSPATTGADVDQSTLFDPDDDAAAPSKAPVRDTAWASENARIEINDDIEADAGQPVENAFEEPAELEPVSDAWESASEVGAAVEPWESASEVGDEPEAIVETSELDEIDETDEDNDETEAYEEDELDSEADDAEYIGDEEDEEDADEDDEAVSEDEEDWEKVDGEEEEEEEWVYVDEEGNEIDADDVEDETEENAEYDEIDDTEDVEDADEEDDESASDIHTRALHAADPATHG